MGRRCELIADSSKSFQSHCRMEFMRILSSHTCDSCGANCVIFSSFRLCSFFQTQINYIFIYFYFLDTNNNEEREREGIVMKKGLSTILAIIFQLFHSQLVLVKKQVILMIINHSRRSCPFQTIGHHPNHLLLLGNRLHEHRHLSTVEDFHLRSFL